MIHIKPPMEHTKLELLLELLLYLSSGIKRTKEEIQERFDLSERSVYRYIETFRKVGFIIPKPREGLYYIDKNSPYFREIDELLHFSKEEAYILQKTIHAISNENLLKQNLIQKLYALYDFDRVADTVVKKEDSHNIHELIRAIQQKKAVLLKGYESANSNIKSDRVIEPFDFTTNYVATWAYDIADGKCKTFKNARIDTVQVLPESWKFGEQHHQLPMDVFRISGKEQIPIGLKLSLRAGNLLMEEYPLAEKDIMPLETGHYILETKVCGFEGVARFMMGLFDEITILHPPELKKLIHQKAKNILTDTD